MEHGRGSPPNSPPTLPSMTGGNGEQVPNDHFMDPHRFVGRFYRRRNLHSLVTVVHDRSAAQRMRLSSSLRPPLTESQDQQEQNNADQRSGTQSAPRYGIMPYKTRRKDYDRASSSQLMFFRVVKIGHRTLAFPVRSGVTNPFYQYKPWETGSLNCSQQHDEVIEVSHSSNGSSEAVTRSLAHSSHVNSLPRHHDGALEIHDANRTVQNETESSLMMNIAESTSPHHHDAIMERCDGIHDLRSETRLASQMSSLENNFPLHAERDNRDEETNTNMSGAVTSTFQERNFENNSFEDHDRYMVEANPSSVSSNSMMSPPQTNTVGNELSVNSLENTAEINLDNDRSGMILALVSESSPGVTPVRTQESSQDSPSTSIDLRDEMRSIVEDIHRGSNNSEVHEETWERPNTSNNHFDAESHTLGMGNPENPEIPENMDFQNWSFLLNVVEHPGTQERLILISDQFAPVYRDVVEYIMEFYAESPELSWSIVVESQLTDRSSLNTWSFHTLNSFLSESERELSHSTDLTGWHPLRATVRSRAQETRRSRIDRLFHSIGSVLAHTSPSRRRHSRGFIRLLRRLWNNRNHAAASSNGPRNDRHQHDA